MLEILISKGADIYGIDIVYQNQCNRRKKKF